MRRSPTADDPRHWTHRDGRTLPVTGTHPPGEPCATCQPAPTRILATAFPVGTLVTWPYGRTGAAHGRVLEHGRTRVSIYWHARRPRPVWLPAARLHQYGPRPVTNCRTCADGR